MIFRADTFIKWLWNSQRIEALGVNFAKQNKGKMAFHSGAAAEVTVERHYREAGYAILARRWRGSGGEIDLIVQREDAYVFVEVKKSRSFELAALRISQAQMTRIFATANEFVAGQSTGMLSEMRFDVALVRSTGEIQILENALHCE